MISLEEIYGEHLQKEPKNKWKWFDKEAGRGIKTDEYSRWDFDRRRLKLLVDLGQTKREEILKVIKSGKKLGEVCKIFNLDISVVSDVLYYNLKKNTYFSLEEVSI